MKRLERCMILQDVNKIIWIHELAQTILRFACEKNYLKFDENIFPFINQFSANKNMWDHNKNTMSL